MSLAAVPVYLLCRRLGLGTAYYSSQPRLGTRVARIRVRLAHRRRSDRVSLVLGAVYVGVVALDSPSRRAQLAVVGLVGLATFARVQYVLLVPVLIVAAVVVERGRIRRAYPELRARVARLRGARDRCRRIGPAASPRRIRRRVRLHASLGRSHTRSACTPCSSRSPPASCSSPAHSSASPAGSRGLAREPKVGVRRNHVPACPRADRAGDLHRLHHLGQLRRALPVLLLPSARCRRSASTPPGGGSRAPVLVRRGLCSRFWRCGSRCRTIRR